MGETGRVGCACSFIMSSFVGWVEDALGTRARIRNPTIEMLLGFAKITQPNVRLTVPSFTVELTVNSTSPPGSTEAFPLMDTVQEGVVPAGVVITSAVNVKIIRSGAITSPAPISITLFFAVAPRPALVGGTFHLVFTPAGALARLAVSLATILAGR